MPQLQISEIFHSLQGEGRTTGFRTAFIRLTGCPLRCGYCDTRYAFTGGEAMALEEILRQVAQYQVQYVTVTGGEPMAQPEVLPLLSQLCDQGYEVSLETSGALDLSEVDVRVIKVMDLKTPASGEVSTNYIPNIALLQPQDQLKFVICDEADYEWSKERRIEYDLAAQWALLVSAC
ncbi:MAG: radical SAM protein, partial [Candidatus Polarisedimenticolaceae bacterium]|nr:radical SAM protein [Candidatus Polarisedimenticolaceae bacterium]